MAVLYLRGRLNATILQLVLRISAYSSRKVEHAAEPMNRGGDYPRPYAHQEWSLSHGSAGYGESLYSIWGWLDRQLQGRHGELIWVAQVEGLVLCIELIVN